MQSHLAPVFGYVFPSFDLAGGFQRWMWKTCKITPQNEGCHDMPSDSICLKSRHVWSSHWISKWTTLDGVITCKSIHPVCFMMPAQANFGKKTCSLTKMPKRVLTLLQPQKTCLNYHWSESSQVPILLSEAQTRVARDSPNLPSWGLTYLTLGIYFPSWKLEYGNISFL